MSYDEVIVLDQSCEVMSLSHVPHLRHIQTGHSLTESIGNTEPVIIFSFINLKCQVLEGILFLLFHQWCEGLC